MRTTIFINNAKYKQLLSKSQHDHHDGHQICLNECEKINFELIPDNMKKGQEHLKMLGKFMEVLVTATSVFEGQDMAIVIITGSNRVDRKKIGENIGI